MSRGPEGCGRPALPFMTSRPIHETGDGAGAFIMPGSRPVLGVLCLVSSSWALSGLDASGKWLMAAGVTVITLCWVRYIGHILLVLALVLPWRGRDALRSVRPRAQLTRGVIMLVATLSFFKTLSLLPQAEATAINFLAPLIVLMLAPWLLNEPARVSRWLAGAAGFVGVLFIIRPGGGLDPEGVVWGLSTAFLFACQYVATRRVAVDNPLTTLIWSGAVGSIALTLAAPLFLPVMVPVFSEMTPLQWVVLLCTGVLGALGHLLQITAYRSAPASLLAPYIYLQIVAAAVLGYLVAGHFPDPLSWVGIAIICSSGAGLAIWEWRRAPTN